MQSNQLDHLDFICIGAQKAGTTTLHDILKQHPDIYLPERKEAHFFDKAKRYSKGLKWWYNEFFSTYSEGQIPGVMTPDYIYVNGVAEKIASDISKDIKLIVVLRQPVDRAYSHYLMSVRKGHETKSFEEAIELEKERITKGEKYNDWYSYLSRGHYLEQLKKYLSIFPRNQFLFLTFEDDIKQNLNLTIEKIQQFIGVEVKELSTDIVSNPASGVHSKQLQKLTRKKSVLSRILKVILPKKTRRKIKERVINLNEGKKIEKTKLSQELRRKIYNENFKFEITELERITGLELSHWNED